MSAKKLDKGGNHFVPAVKFMPACLMLVMLQQYAAEKYIFLIFRNFVPVS
jgi:hypothetical protein